MAGESTVWVRCFSHSQLDDVGFPTFDDEVRAGCQLPDQHLDRIWAKKKLINTWRHGKIYRKAKSEFGKVMY